MDEELYQDLLIEYSRSKKHHGSLGEGAQSVQLKNPLCGDDIELWVEFNQGIVKNVRFLGQGCLISQAAASLMAELTEGKSVEQARALAQDFEVLLQGKATDDIRERIGDLVILEGVSKLPARLRCALLAFEAFGKLIPQES